MKNTAGIKILDFEEVKVHEESVPEIEKKLPDLYEIYNTLGKYTVKIAKNQGKLDESIINKMIGTLGD